MIIGVSAAVATHGSSVMTLVTFINNSFGDPFLLSVKPFPFTKFDFCRSSQCQSPYRMKCTRNYLNTTTIALFFLIKDFAPDDEEGCGGKGGRVSAGNSADKKSKREELRGFATDKEKSDQHENDCQRVVK